MIGNRHQLRADVGLGTFGRVVMCWDVKRCRRVAVKIVRKARARILYSSPALTHRAFVIFSPLAFAHI